MPELFSVWKDEGWIEPTIMEQFDPDRTVLTMSFEKRVREEKCE